MAQVQIRMEKRAGVVDNAVATFVSALMCGEVRVRDIICATVILEELNVGKANLQPESICALKFFRAI